MMDVFELLFMALVLPIAALVLAVMFLPMNRSDA